MFIHIILQLMFEIRKQNSFIDSKQIELVENFALISGWNDQFLALESQFVQIIDDKRCK